MKRTLLALLFIPALAMAEPSLESLTRELCEHHEKYAKTMMQYRQEDFPLSTALPLNLGSKELRAITIMAYEQPLLSKPSEKMAAAIAFGKTIGKVCMLTGGKYD